MKKILLMIGILFFGLISSLGATSPSIIELTYEPGKKNLRIKIVHAAHDPREHHIRKVEVSLNDEKPTNLYFATQTAPAFLTMDVALEAKPGDNIRVLAICNEAGRLEKTLTVSMEDDKASQDIQTPQTEKKSKDAPQTHKSSY